MAQLNRGAPGLSLERCRRIGERIACPSKKDHSPKHRARNEMVGEQHGRLIAGPGTCGSVTRRCFDSVLSATTGHDTRQKLPLHSEVAKLPEKSSFHGGMPYW